MAKAIILYHKYCIDGKGAAWAAWEHYQGSVVDITVNPSYQDDIVERVEEEYKKLNNPDVDILAFDIGFSGETLSKLLERFPKIKVFDHHESSFKSIKEKFEDNLPENYTYSENDCGASLAWKYFNKDKELPAVIDYIRQRDTWKFESKDSEIVCQGLYKLLSDLDYSDFGSIINGVSIQTMRLFGNALDSDTKQKLRQLNKNGKTLDIFGFKFRCINTTEHISDLGNFVCKLREKYTVVDEKGDILIEKENYCADIALIWYYNHNDNKYKVCLRSNNERDIDTTVISKKFGGGGHKCASGFCIDDINELFKSTEFIN